MSSTRTSRATRASHAALVDAWLASQTSPTTRAAYRTDLNTFGRWCARRQAVPLAADTATVVAFHLARQAAGDSAATMRRRWSSLSSFYEFAIDSGRATTNPVAELVPAPEPEAAERGIDRRGSAAVDDYLAMTNGLDPRLEALVALMVEDGPTPGGALTVDVVEVVGAGDVGGGAGRPPRVIVTVHRSSGIRRLGGDGGLTGGTYRHAGHCCGELRIAGGRRSASPRRLTRLGTPSRHHRGERASERHQHREETP